MKKIVFLALLMIGLSGVVCAQQEERSAASTHQAVMLEEVEETEEDAPARPGVIERVQPDGDTLHICLRGDERSHYTMTTDRWQIKEDKNGYLCYAIQKKDGSIVASKKVAHDADKRSKCENKWLRRKGLKKN